MKVEEIKAEELDVKQFIKQKTADIKSEVGKNIAMVALSGGIDSSVTTILAYHALGDQLKPYFIETGFMRKNESQQVAKRFSHMRIEIIVLDEQETFIEALKGIIGPEKKREAISQAFYNNVFKRIAQEQNIKYLLQGTTYFDVLTATSHYKRHHNVLTQLGINTEKEYGYRLIEPIVQLRKDGVKKVAKELGLPSEIYNRMAFPGPGLAVRVMGEVTKEKLEIVRNANAIVEEELTGLNVGHCLALLHADTTVGVRNGKRKDGYTIEVRCRDYDSPTNKAVELDWNILRRLSCRITEINDVVNVVYSLVGKPPCSVEAE